MTNKRGLLNKHLQAKVEDVLTEDIDLTADIKINTSYNNIVNSREELIKLYMIKVYMMRFADMARYTHEQLMAMDINELSVLATQDDIYE